MAQITLNSSGVASDGALVLQSNGTTNGATIDTSSRLIVGADSAAYGSRVEIVANTSGEGVRIRGRTSDGLGTVSFGVNAAATEYARIAGDNTSSLQFGTGSSGTERARITSGGDLQVGKTAISNTVKGATIGQDGQLNIVLTNAGGGSQCIFLNRQDATGDVVLIRQANNTVGSISVTASATAYNTSSDYRLKENIAPMTGALAKVALLKPVTYKWKVDGSEGEGFIAHELAEVVSGCVTGEKDAVDAEGNPQYQGIDTSFLVATLTAAIQEQQAIITQLQADVAALKGTA